MSAERPGEEYVLIGEGPTTIDPPPPPMWDNYPTLAHLKVTGAPVVRVTCRDGHGRKAESLVVVFVRTPAADGTPIWSRLRTSRAKDDGRIYSQGLAEVASRHGMTTDELRTAMHREHDGLRSAIRLAAAHREEVVARLRELQDRASALQDTPGELDATDMVESIENLHRQTSDLDRRVDALDQEYRALIERDNSLRAGDHENPAIGEMFTRHAPLPMISKVRGELLESPERHGYRLACPVCRFTVPVRRERLDPVLDRLTAAGVSVIRLRALALVI